MRSETDEEKRKGKIGIITIDRKNRYACQAGYYKRCERKRQGFNWKNENKHVKCFQMISELNKLSRPELLELYHDRMVKTTNIDKRMSLLSMSSAYFLALGNFAPFKDNFQVHFFNTLAERIYDSNPHSILIQNLIDTTPDSIITKAQVIEKIGSMGIKTMNEVNFNKILSLYECIHILYNVYLKNTSCDLEELMGIFQSYFPQHIQENDHEVKTEKRSFFNVLGYYQFLCNILNNNGFQYYDFDTGRLGKWKASSYFMASINGRNHHHQKAFKFLKKHGYFNMGICPKCGGVMKDETYTYYSILNPKFNYPICHHCYNARIRPSMKAGEGKKECYIATACYGDFNAVEVQTFRAYRDRVLCRSFSGRLFITAYYFLSPYVARYLKRKPSLNHHIKVRILDKIYRKIST